MPVEILQDGGLHLVRAPGASIALRVRARPGGAGPVELLRVLPGDALRPWIRDGGSCPYLLAPGQERELRLEVVEEPSSEVAGEMFLHVAEAGLTSERSFRLRIAPDRDFAGVVGVDLGASRLAAAVIDPAVADGRPVPVELVSGRFDLDTTFTVDLATRPPLRVEPETALQQHDDPRAANLFFRPRVAFIRGGRRPLRQPDGQHAFVDGAQIVAWQLSDLARRIAMRPGLGRPRQLALAVPPGLAAERGARLAELAHLAGVELDSAMALDETTAIALAWVGQHRDELEGRCARAGGEWTPRIVVLDAGATAVDIGLIDLGLSATDGGLVVRPAVLSRDSFAWLAGDRVTGYVFRQLKAEAALQIDPTAEPEAILPTSFRDVSWPAATPRIRNFLAIWEAAEQLKHRLGVEGPAPGPSCQVAGLAGCSGHPLPPSAVRLNTDRLASDLREDVRSCRDRLENFLTRDEGAGRFEVDVLIVAGGAARFAPFGDMVEGLRTSLRSRGPGGGTPRFEDWTDQGKQAVAAGTALAAYDRRFAPPIGLAGRRSRLSFHFDEFDAHLPYSVAYHSGGAIRTLFARHTRFPSEGGRAGPLVHPNLPWQPTFSFSTYAGARAEGGLARHLGVIEPPDTGTVDVILRPDHAIEIQAGGRSFPLVEAHGSRTDPDCLNDPFGRL